ncbi:MAG: sulfotransferase family protein [Desulfomonilaceae bacterium]
MKMFWNKGISLQIVQGMPLGSLIRLLAGNDFLVNTRHLGRLAYLIGIGVFNSILGSCERFFDGAEIEKIELSHPPLFILGHWRSGTTHLHNLLSLDNEFSSPNVYQCLFPNHFIYSQVGSVALKILAPDTRPMDNVSFSSRAPHEEEFALAALSLVSPYLRVIFPLTGHNWHTSLDLDKVPPKWRQAWKDAFIFFLKKLELSEGGRPLLKSPPNTARIKYLLELFPHAQFVHIVRNPYRVYLSTRNLWDKSFSKTRLQEPSRELVQELILSWYVEMFELLDRDRALIPPGRLHELKFEDLELSPLGELEKIYAALGLKNFDLLERQAVQYLETIKTYKKNVFDLDENTRALVAEKWRNNFDKYGYEI